MKKTTAHRLVPLLLAACLASAELTRSAPRTDAGDAARLITAVRSGDRTMVRSLLRAKADVNAAEADGTTPLQWAAQADDLEMVRLLLANGAQVGAANRYGVKAF